MLFFLLICAEIEITDNKLDDLKKKQNEVREKITGEKEEITTSATTIKNQAHAPKKSEPQDNSAKICISEGGCPTSNDTAASNIREAHYEINTAPNRPLNTACGGHDVFEPRNPRDPDLPPK